MVLISDRTNKYAVLRWNKSVASLPMVDDSVVLSTDIKSELISGVSKITGPPYINGTLLAPKCELSENRSTDKIISSQ